MFKRNQYGFTLVELLIVIVVIAILASISVVAYSGIQTRAKNTSTIQTARNMSSALQMYAIENTTLSANTVTKDHLCLGNPGDYPAASGLGAGECRNDVGQGNWRADDNFTDELSSVGRVSGATPLITATDGQIYRGIWYDDNLSTDPYMYYALQGEDQSCGLGGAIPTSGDGITVCALSLPFMIQYS